MFSEINDPATDVKIRNACPPRKISREHTECTTWGGYDQRRTKRNSPRVSYPRWLLVVRLRRADGMKTTDRNTQGRIKREHFRKRAEQGQSDDR